MKKYYIILLVTCSVTLTACCGNCRAEMKEKRMHNLPAGIVPGQMVVLSGRIDHPAQLSKADEDRVYLLAEKLDGKPLPSPTRIELRFFAWNPALDTSQSDQVLNLTGYFSGGWEGIPDQAFTSMPRVATEGFHYQTWFQVCKF